MSSQKLYSKNNKNVPNLLKKCDKDGENKRQCARCCKFYSSKQSLWNHKQICSKISAKSSQCKKDFFSKEYLQRELALEKKKNQELEKKTRELLEKRIGDLEEERQTTNYIMKINAESTKNATDTAKYSMSALGFLTKHFTSAKPIKTFDDFKALGGENNKRPAEIAVLYSQSDQHKYHVFIGDILIKYYKKNCPSQQAVWTSDPSRNNYIVREKTSKSDTWVIDKNGYRTVLSMIDPLLEYLLKDIVAYLNEGGLLLENPDTCNNSSLLKKHGKCW